MDYNLLSTDRRKFLQLGIALACKWFFFPGQSIAKANISLLQQSNECIIRPQQTEGPYFRDEMLNRSDIRIEPSDGSILPGTTLKLNIRVSQTDGNSCTPMSGAIVDIWHCDALGIYSDVADPNFDTRGKKFLRGYQVTDQNGIASFLTIYPGWYQSRAVHIHFKIRKDPSSINGLEFTSQLYFDDTVSNEIFGSEPYTQNNNNRITNSRDGIYQNGGSQLLVPLLKENNEYTGTFDIAFQIEPQTGVKDEENPDGFYLNQNYPNPFNATTEIEYSIITDGRVTIKLYDSLGVETRVLVDDILSAGRHKVRFDASGLNSGIYYYQLKAQKNLTTRKLVLLK